MDVEEFAARRRAQFTDVDELLQPYVERSLSAYARGDTEWYEELVTQAGEVWQFIYVDESPNADPTNSRYTGFLADLEEALLKTAEPDDPPTEAQIDRVTKWLGTYTVNSATFNAAGARGARLKRWVTMHDSSVREIHVEADGQTRAITAPFRVGGYELDFPGDPVGPPEVWINCVVGSTQVEWPGQSVLAVTRREQSGTFVDLHTVDGHDLTVTPNHPVLTPGGYVPAHLLCPGDQVMASRLTVAPQVADMEPRVEQVYRASAERGQTTRIGGGAVDFHGDIAEQEVEVVWPDSDLSAELWRESMERGLIRAASVPVESAVAVGATVTSGGMPVGGCGLATGILSTLGEVATLLRTHPRHAQAVRLGPATDDKIEFIEALDDDIATDVEFVRHLQHAVAAGMTVSQISEVKVYSAVHEVYNLHTSDQWYTANGITVHNCRCVMMAAARTGEASMTPTTFAVTDEADIAVEPVDDEELPNDDLEEGEENITEIPVHGVLAPEGVPTGDGRQFAEGALTSRDLPLPIAYQLMSAEGHLNSVTVGRIDEINRVGNELRFRGMLVLTKEHTPAVVEGIIDGTVRGVSVDVDDIELDMSMDEPDMDSGKMPLTVFSKARVAGVTIVPIPAFQEAFIGLGHEFADEMTPEDQALLASCGCEMGGKPGLIIDGEEIEDDNPDIETGYDLTLTPAQVSTERINAEGWGTQSIAAFRRGPGWLTNPADTRRLHHYWTSPGQPGYAKIGWGRGGDFMRAVRLLAKYVEKRYLYATAAQWHHDALGYWPATHARAIAASGTPAPIFNLVAAASRTFEADKFARVDLEDPRVGIMVEGDHVFGYMAQWGVCHIGITGICTEAPSSQTDYWYYATGIVDTTEGPIHVGQITMDTGHASLKSNAKIAAAHYDNTGSAVADVSVGEDAFGIWFSGVLRPTITDDQLHALRASGRISGDWRTIGGNLEMVAGLVVNVPGLPIPHTMVASADGVQTALVAAGVVSPADSPAPAVTASVTIGADPEMIAAIARTAVAEYRHAEKREARTAPLRESLRQKRIETLRIKIKE